MNLLAQDLVHSRQTQEGDLVATVMLLFSFLLFQSQKLMGHAVLVRRPETWSLGSRLGREKEEPWVHLELGSVFGSGQERKYAERAALGLAIWAEMLAAGVGVRRRG